jgi:hypothetical protein
MPALGVNGPIGPASYLLLPRWWLEWELNMSYLRRCGPTTIRALEIIEEHDPTFDADSYDHFVCIFNGLSGGR